MHLHRQYVQRGAYGAGLRDGRDLDHARWQAAGVRGGCLLLAQPEDRSVPPDHRLICRRGNEPVLFSRSAPRLNGRLGGSPWPARVHLVLHPSPHPRRRRCTRWRASVPSHIYTQNPLTKGVFLCIIWQILKQPRASECFVPDAAL